jgi:acetylxylan esterase
MLDSFSPRKVLTTLILGAGLVAAQFPPQGPPQGMPQGMPQGAPQAPAQLQTITNFGPTYNTQLQLQAYIPSRLPANPAVILAVSNILITSLLQAVR